MTTKSEEISASQSLKEFVKSHTKKNKISLRKLSAAIDIAPSYLSEVLNGKKKISIELLNALAEFLQVPRVDVYQAAGLINLNKDDLKNARYKEMQEQEPLLVQFEKLLDDVEETQRTIMTYWLFSRAMAFMEVPEDISLPQEILLDVGNQLLAKLDDTHREKLSELSIDECVKIMRALMILFNVSDPHDLKSQRKILNPDEILGESAKNLSSS
jgi:transcriptional regulator with XRE-family HTH domain